MFEPERSHIPHDVLLAILAAIAIAWSVAASMVYLTELQVAEYKTAADAEADGAIERGWLPAFLPSSATDIREVHDLDTNTQWLTFRAPAEDLHRMVQPFAPLPYAEARRTALLRPWRVKGSWPPELSEPHLSTPRDTQLLGYYRTSVDRLCMAVEWRTGRAWAWSCERRPTSGWSRST